MSFLGVRRPERDTISTRKSHLQNPESHCVIQKQNLRCRRGSFIFSTLSSGSTSLGRGWDRGFGASPPGSVPAATCLPPCGPVRSPWTPRAPRASASPSAGGPASPAQDPAARVKCWRLPAAFPHVQPSPSSDFLNPLQGLKTSTGSQQ